MNKFLICAHARSGSYNLVGILNSHPEIFCTGEIFSESWISNLLSYNCNWLEKIYGTKLIKNLKEVEDKLMPNYGNWIHLILANFL